jgi:beta-glucosidase
MNKKTNLLNDHEKIALTSGESFWKTRSLIQHDIPSIMLCDGPHGLRKQNEGSDHLGINDSVPATCFPTAALLASTWDEKLIEEVGKHIGLEAHHHHVDVVLGPGVNLKRNPLCGRNFEYFSEDPLLSGKMGAAWIKGVESQGIGTSLKHYLGNNQENYRLISNSIIDKKALNELYLKSFEIALKEGQPSTVMCSYNKVNGVYLSDHKELIHDTLRQKWGFNGVVVTDWGALNNKIDSINAGTDLEMPNSNQLFDSIAYQGLKNKELKIDSLNQSVDRILNLVDKQVASRKDIDVDFQKHHDFARLVASEGAVLLKNDKLLPLSNEVSITLLGELAFNTRYQGAGSSHINPTQLSHIQETMKNRFVSFNSHNTYTLNSSIIEDVKKSEVVFIVMGLPDSFESEGYDRTHMSIPLEQVQMLTEVRKHAKKVGVILVGGSPVDLSWDIHCDGLLNMYLGGQAVGDACCDILLGDINPSGKLAETFPHLYEHVPSSKLYGTYAHVAPYEESIYVGYRYYEKAKIGVKYPFGFGLSYSSFEYLKSEIKEESDSFTLSVSIRNHSSHFGKEIIQVYLSDETTRQFKPLKTLVGFKKVGINPNEVVTVSITIQKDSFKCFDTHLNDWVITQGQYKLLIGSSSQMIHASHEVFVDGTLNVNEANIPEVYKTLTSSPSLFDFELLIHEKIDSNKPALFSIMSSLNEISHHWLAKAFISGLKKSLVKSFNHDESNEEFKFIYHITLNTPMQRLSQQSAGQAPLNIFKMLFNAANGNYIKAFKELLRK